jgi:hypothetical protein
MFPEQSTPPQTPIDHQPQLPPQQPSIVYQPPIIPAAVPFEQPKSRKWLYIGIAAFTVVLLIIGGLVSFALNKQHNQTSNSTNSAVNSPGNTTPVSVDLSKAYDEASKAGVKEFSTSKKSSVLSAYQSLTSGFAFKSTKASPAKQLLVLGIAYHYSIDQGHKDALRSSMYLAYIDDLTNLPSGINDKTFHAATQTDDQTLAVLKKFEDSSLSSKVQSAITSSQLEAEVKKNLNLVSTANLTAYTVIAMNFNAISPEQQNFAKQHYMYGAAPKMWVEILNNHTYVLMAKDYATNFVTNPQGSARSTVIHEFIHGQNPFVVGDLGHSIEERRAEYFSGDKSAYYDAKQLFIYGQVFSGVDMLKQLSDNALNPYQYYIALYKQFGVTTANKLIASRPTAYLTQASGAVSAVQAYTGGPNGFIKDTISMGSKDKNAMQARKQARHEKLLSVLKTEDAVTKDLKNNLSGSYQMPDAAAEMLK